MSAIAAKARAVAASLECKKDGLRQTQAGEWKLTLTVLDLPAWLMSAKMGTRLMAALVEIGDDEEPVEHATSEVPRETRGEQNSGAPKVDTKEEWNVGWSEPTIHSYSNSAAKERFKALGKPEQMVAKCGMTCASPKFQEFLQVATEEEAIAEVYRVCHIKSRSELLSNPEAQRIWERMVTDYDLWRQALPEMRG